MTKYKYEIEETKERLEQAKLEVERLQDRIGYAKSQRAVGQLERMLKGAKTTVDLIEKSLAAYIEKAGV